MLADEKQFIFISLLGIGSGGRNSIKHLFTTSTFSYKLGSGSGMTSFESQHCSKPNRYVPYETTMQLDITYDKIQSIIAMFVAWFIGYIYFAVRMVHFSGWGYVTDFSAVFFWTAFFALVSSITFVPLTIKLFNKTELKKIFFLFPMMTMLVSQVALTILLLPLLISSLSKWDFFTTFMPELLVLHLD